MLGAAQRIYNHFNDEWKDNLRAKYVDEALAMAAEKEGLSKDVVANTNVKIQ